MRRLRPPAHASPPYQRTLRERIVREALARVAGLDEPPVPTTVELASEHYRTTLRCRVVPDGPGFRKRASHEVVAVDSCLIAHPLIEELLLVGDFGEAEEVTIRVGARTGERLVLASPTASAVHLPDDVLVVGADELAAGRRAWIHEEVAGRRWRISAQSFFQARPDGAEALVAAVARAIEGVPPDARLVDAYAGVGLFAGTVGAARPTVAIERSRSSVADARINLKGSDARLVGSSVDRWRASPAAVVVADPPRAGLGRVGADRLCATGADRFVLISCDAAALARDTGLLRSRGYELVDVTIVDLFPHTSHIETVARFDRVRPPIQGT